MAEVITKALKELRARQTELSPLAAELRQVEAAITALEPSERSAGGRSRRNQSAARMPAGRPRRGRPRKGEPTRADQLLALVREQPGISITEAAQRMSVQPSYLYRVSAKLGGGKDRR